jgi:galactofuranosylgalactofuranosylrhamnosyl-N-acetylglucosaminyl-diphospho-decaprenol beta-1,5/1,6-galactofuranosyltransferase
MTQMLQRLTLPKPETTEPLLYARLVGESRVVADGVVLASGAQVSFDTSFGVFAAGRWRRVSTVNQLSVEVRASGIGVVEVVAVTGNREEVVAHASLPRGEGAPTSVVLPLEPLQTSKHGTYFVRVRADGGEVCMTGGQWITSDAPAHDVRLSLSITTFNRQEYVRKTVHNVLQLESELAALTGRLRVFVVDNAQNVTFDAAPNAPLQVVPNGNLGGAGGFARGLMELRKQGLGNARVVHGRRHHARAGSAGANHGAVCICARPEAVRARRNAERRAPMAAVRGRLRIFV